MPTPPDEDLETFLRRQDAGDLVAVLLALARDREAVRARLARMQLADRPDRLAADFMKTLSGWRRSTKFHGYREAGEFGRMLDGWLDQVARELLPKEPPAALSLFESFIEADATWFDRADDSDGVIGDAVRAACRHWLQAAARCETAPGVWPERLLKLYQADQYGARDELLRRAGLLLDEPAQRGLVARLESQLAQALDASPRGEGPPIDVFRISGALSLMAESLRDPDISVRATLRFSPSPNPLARPRVRAWRDRRLPCAVEGHPPSGLCARLWARGALLGPAWRYRGQRRQPDAPSFARGLRGRGPCASRTQGGVLGVRERNAPRPARRRGRYGRVVLYRLTKLVHGRALGASHARSTLMTLHVS